MADLTAAPTIPQHHTHKSSDPLPSKTTADNYAPENVERTPSSAWDQPRSQHDPAAPQTTSASGNNAFHSERPLGVQPTPAGGVAIGGHDGLPEGKATFGDKIAGKAQKIIGKATHNPATHEKGELREAGGKAAVLGQARAPHD